MINHLVDLKLDVELLKSAFGNALRVGPVVEVDAKKGYRLDLSAEGDDEPFFSPWLPHPETGKTSLPLEKGQTVGLVSPSGDMRQGLLFRGGYSGGQPSPNDDMLANVLKAAGVRIEIRDGKVIISAPGGVEITGPVTIDGDKLTHNGTDIGDTHKHGGVQSGPAETDEPV